MRRALLVTAREYRRMMSLPAFWVVSLIVPVFVLAVPVESRLFRKSQTVAYVLVDKSGGYARQIKQRLELDYQRQLLGQLLAYLQQWRAGNSVSGAAPLPEAGSSSSEAMVQNFVATGGAPAVLRLMKSRLLPGAPAFEAPPRPLVEIAVPEGVATDSLDRFGASIGPHFGLTFETPAGKAVLGVAVYIPDNVDAASQVRVWTDGPVGATLVQELRSELTERLRLQALRAAGVDALSAAQIESLSAPLSIGPAPTVRKIIPSVRYPARK